jgi:pyruvate, water dikinase
MNFVSKILSKVIKKENESGKQNFLQLKQSYEIFSNILDMNNRALSIIGDMKEKASGEYIFDRNYINKSVDDLIKVMNEFCNNFIMLGGKKYSDLNNINSDITYRIEDIIGTKTTSTDKYVILLAELVSTSASFAGSKNANLGELTSIPYINVPDGFAITTLSFNTFIQFNNLEEKINSIINQVNIGKFGDLVFLSEKIQKLILESEIPEQIAKEIISAYNDLMIHEGSETRISVRSSAIGEDTQFSFAGQYKTVLNVGRDSILDAYKQVLASKFNHKAIYYFLSHGLNESELAMSVGCYIQINSIKSGVIYTQNPAGGSENILIINAIRGQGKLLVDGSESPEIISVSKKDLSITERISSLQKKKLIIDEYDKLKLVEISISEDTEVLSDDEVNEMAESAIIIENHYGCPQDIEWAIDDSGKLFMLQARPLKVFPKSNVKMPDTSNYEIVLEGGITACPGAGSGIIYNTNNPNEIGNIPAKSVIVSNNPVPGLLAAIREASAFVCKTGSMASHLVTIAREYGIPTLVGINDTDILTDGELVTVDAVNAVIYKGEIPELIDTLKPDEALIDEIQTLQTLKRINAYITPLNLTDVNNDSFKIESCKSYHDILRFVHQKAIEEMFETARKLSLISSNRIKLKSEIPLKLEIIYLDKIPANKKNIDDTEIESKPLNSFWSGVLHEGWTIPPAIQDMKGLLSVVATDMTNQKLNKLAEKSYAVAADDFMILSLRMGYHYSTIEAFAGIEPSKNYIKLKYMEGGAMIERRVRRIRIITDILRSYGFIVVTKSDFLDASISYESIDITLEKLFMLGRMTMLTKQLDMALTDDEDTESYKEEIIEKLSLNI